MGYYKNNLGTLVSNQLTAIDGSAYAGLHSSGAFPQEVMQITLNTNAVINTGEKIEISFLAHQFTISTFFPNSGHFDVYGITPATATPTLNASSNTNTIAATNGINFLGRSAIISNTSSFQEYIISFTAANNYDRLLFVPTSLQIAGTGTTTDTFLGIDRIILREHIDTDGDTIPNYFDKDSDNDGCFDAIEGGQGFALTDLDADNELQNINATTGLSTDVTNQTNGQAIGTSLDNTLTSVQCDDDGDGVPNITDVCNGFDDTADNDNDGVPDGCDLDDDNDGILDTHEGNTNYVNQFLFGPDFYSNPTSNITPHPTNGTGASGVFDGNTVFDSPTGSFGQWNNSVPTGIFNPALILNVDLVQNIDRVTGFAMHNDAGPNDNHSVLDFDVYITVDGVEYKESLTSSGAISGNAGQSAETFTFSRAYHNVEDLRVEIMTADSDLVQITELGFIGTVSTTIDTDGDTIPNSLDLDSDGDDCPDALESAVHDALVAGDVDNLVSGTLTTTSMPNAKVSGAVGDNGYLNVLEDVDTAAAVVVDTYFNTNYTTYALDGSTSACGVGMITQVFDDPASDRWIEVTNTHATDVIPPHGVTAAVFVNPSGSLSGEDADGFFPQPNALQPGETFIISTNGAVANIASGVTDTAAPMMSLTTSATTTDYTITLMRGKSSTLYTYDGSYEVLPKIPAKTSWVRKDEVTQPNRVYTSDEWVAFIDDAIVDYTDNQDDPSLERHPHAPLLSEINTALATDNMRPGVHKVGPTVYQSGAWSNGTPDRSRKVRVLEDYTTSSLFGVRALEVDNGSTFSISDNALVVSESVNIVGANDEIRLVSSDDTNKAQLVQTHEGSSGTLGLGKLLVDQNSTVPSTYRYNYLSSPVNTIGQNTYRVADVLKDGTTKLGTNNTNGAKDINFIGGYDGAATDPISIAEYWIYTYASASGNVSNWASKGSTGVIPATDGFIMKGPGVAQNYTFEGAPKDGTLTTAIGAGESYLVGNPYASALSVRKFIQDNPSTTGTLYFWQHVGETDTSSTNTSGHNYGGYVGGYATINLSAAVAANQTSLPTDGRAGALGTGYVAPGMFVPIGQGFFIEGAAGGAVSFNNSQRTYVTEGSTSVFYKSADKTKKTKTASKSSTSSNGLPVLKLGFDYLSEDQVSFHRQLAISFKQGNSFAVERGYDSEIYDIGVTDAYWKFPTQDEKFVIAGVQAITKDLEVPLEVVMNYNGEVRFSIDELEGIEEDLFIEDKLTGVSYPLSEQGFAITLAKGVYTDRFFVSFEKPKETNSGVLGVDDISLLEEAIQVYKSSDALVIVNTQNNVIDHVSLYTVLGQSVQEWKEATSESEVRLPLRNVAAGVYLVNVNTENGVAMKKIVIE
ncbi:T9SS type A sorting domain-containing protein [Polaribacter tangerinus]|uniref:T9SS type A sorting domain-containing protein n=3 Tax=Polaribacter tangerinus TaxID=1920034 RepID=UPI0030F5E72A